MAGGSRSDLFGLGGRAACVLFWRGAEKILGAGGLANGGGAPCRIPNELFGIAGEFFPAGADGERQREEADRYCRVAGRACRSGEDLSASDDFLRGFAAGVRGILPGLPREDGERGASRWANPGGLRFGPVQRVTMNCNQSLPSYSTFSVESTFH